MLRKIISGFQDGADLGGVEAAREAGVATGGFMPQGYRTESGPRPEYAERFGAHELGSPSYAYRNRRNVSGSDATIVFAANFNSPGTRLTIELCGELRRPCLMVPSWDLAGCSPERAAAWIVHHGPAILNVAGNRESNCPGIREGVREYMAEVFAILASRGLLHRRDDPPG